MLYASTAAAALLARLADAREERRRQQLRGAVAALPGRLRLPARRSKCAGWPTYSRPSAVVRTKTLPRAPTGAVRVELKLSEELPPEHSGLQSHLATDLALALEVDKSRIDIVEVRRKGLFFIFDLLAADGSAPTPEDLAHSLARLAGNQRSVLYEGSLTRGVDPKAPPLFVLADGSVAPIEAPDTIAGLAGRFTFAIASVIAITACATVFLRTLNAGGGANGSGGGYGGGGCGDGKPSRRRTPTQGEEATYGSVDDGRRRRLGRRAELCAERQAGVRSRAEKSS